MLYSVNKVLLLVCASAARDSWDEQDFHRDTQAHKQPVTYFCHLHGHDANIKVHTSPLTLKYFMDSRNIGWMWSAIKRYFLH